MHFPRLHTYIYSYVEIKSQAKSEMCIRDRSCRLDLATAEKDIDTILDTMEVMLTTLDDITSFSTSPLYEHMDFKKSNSTFSEQLKEELLNCFQDKETYGFLEGNERWHKIMQK